MSATVTANDGTMLPIDSLNLAFVYVATFLSTITTMYAGNLFVQTFTNNGTNITNISQWQNPANGFAAMDTQDGAVMLTEDGNIMVMEI